jgi:hypothetical protein
MWDLKAGGITDLKPLEENPTGEAPGFTGGVMDLAFTPDGGLYSAGWGGVRRWNLERRTSETVVDGPIMIMDLSRDGRHLLTATRQNRPAPLIPSVVDFHDLPDRTSRRLSSHESDVVAVCARSDRDDRRYGQ